MASIISEVVEYVAEVSGAGPESVAFDGLRAFQHPIRIRQHLTGHSVDVVPVTIDLWPTVVCDSECPLCQYRRSGAREMPRIGKRPGYLTGGSALGILEGAARLGVRSIIFTGGGEPLLNADVTALVQLCVRQRLRWGLITNGHMLLEHTAAKLLALNPTFLRVSLNAGSAQTYHDLYGLDERFFEKTIAHTVAAARIAAALSQPIGVSFALPSTIDGAELRAIRKVLNRIVSQSSGGMRFVVFRPMLEHYDGLQPICPQRNHERFRELPADINDLIVQPLVRDGVTGVRFDTKAGLFIAAALDRLPAPCVSANWMTTITDMGEGYMTGELAGQKAAGLCWGTVTSSQSFESVWGGEVRRQLHECLVHGDIPMPLVHRTTPLDVFLQGLDAITGGPVEERIADEIITCVTGSAFYRSAAYDFV